LSGSRFTFHVSRYALLIALFALLTAGARRLPLTADEPAHIAVGYALLARGTDSLPLLPPYGHPPLLAALEALPLYARNPTIPVAQLAGWPDAYDRYYQSFQPYLRAEAWAPFAARLPTIFLTVILAAVVARWARDLWGPRAALLALVALACDPTLLAHGRLATTDVGSVAFGTAALYATWRWTQPPARWRWALGAGCLLGLTLLSKQSGVLWAAAAGAVVLTAVLRPRPPAVAILGGRRGPPRLQIAVAAALSLAVLWAGYGFTGGTVGGVDLPAPGYWTTFLHLDRFTTQNVVFALGRRSLGGWWWYYPLAFLIKNPLPLLIGWGLGLLTLLRRPLSAARLLALGLFPLLYTGAAVASGMNIGYRHLLPIHPFLHLILGGGLARWGWTGVLQPWRRLALAALGLWTVVGTVRLFPNEIAYFNELIGGSDEGYRYLVDSNLDWGQSARTLQDYLETNPSVRDEPPAARFSPPPGRVIVSASYLQGVGISDPDAYEWLRHREPTAILDHTLLVYDVPPFPAAWFAQCTQPEAPLDEATIAAGTGRADLRLADFDCTQSWLYPAPSGLYALHHDLLHERACLLRCPPAPDDAFLARRLAPARLSYEQERPGRRPAFVLYELSTAPAPPAVTVYGAAAATAPSALPADPLRTPLALDGPLAFLGAMAYTDDETLEVETWWRATAGPITRSLSLMGHLLSADGQVLGAADGLGVSPIVWRSGDVIVQRHRFLQPAGETILWLRTGAYWLDTMTRWSVVGSPVADAIFVRLEVTP